MPAPAWFFSTLAQAIAAAIGFVIAFTASVYSFRNSVFRERVSTFQRDIGELHSIYGPILDALEDYLRENAEFDSSSEIWINLQHENLDDWANKQPDPQSAKVWAHVKAVSDFLSVIPSEESPEQIQIHFEKMEYSIDRLQELFDYQTEGAELLYEELIGEIPNERDLSRKTIFDLPYRARRQFKGNSVRERDNTTRLSNWTQIVADFKTDYEEIKTRYGTRWLTSSNSRSRAREVLQQSIELFAVGVVLPIIFLLSPPIPIENFISAQTSQTVDVYGIFTIQLVILFMVVVMTSRLYNSLGRLI
jgi:hypothetical protein